MSEAGLRSTPLDRIVPVPSDLRVPLRHTRAIRGGAQTFECGAEETHEAVILRPSGEVDLATVPAFRDALTAAGKRERPIVVDMSGIEYIDSGGIHAFFDHVKSSKEHGDFLMLVATHGTVQRVIEITNLDHAVLVLASVEVALDLIRSRTSRMSNLVQMDAEK